MGSGWHLLGHELTAFKAEFRALWCRVDRVVSLKLLALQRHKQMARLSAFAKRALRIRE